MNEEIKQLTEVKEVEMYYYMVNGIKLWTSNLMFAQLRASKEGTDNVFVEKIELKNLIN
jgi:hypothetical protein